MRDDTVWTRIPTGNDSNVILTTIGHFSDDFQVSTGPWRPTPDGLDWSQKCPDDLRTFKSHFGHFWAKSVMRDGMVWTRMPTGNDSDVIFPTIGHFSGDF